MLKAFFEENPIAAVAFSGGVDSSYLLYQAVKYAERVTAYCVASVFHTRQELEDVKRMADELGAELSIIELDVLADEKVAENSPQRCYFCKKRLLQSVKDRAEADGYSIVIEGSNADDDPAERPGMRALEELGVRSPLREAGLSKTDVRRLSGEAGLFTWNKPSNSCAATRVPTGVRLEAEILEKIKAGRGLCMSWASATCACAGAAAGRSLSCPRSSWRQPLKNEMIYLPH